MIINPRTIFQGSVDKDGVITVLGGYLDAVVATANQTIVPAVTGKIIRVVSMIIGSSTAAVVGATIQSNNTAISGTLNVPPNTIWPLVLEFNEAGWFDTVVSQALKISVGAGSNANTTIRYITFTP